MLTWCLGLGRHSAAAQVLRKRAHSFRPPLPSFLCTSLAPCTVVSDFLVVVFLTVSSVPNLSIFDLSAPICLLKPCLVSLDPDSFL